MFGFNLADILLYVPITLIAITVHEFAHGWVSYKLGDPTPQYEGRLTLNPLAHLDLVGTLLMIFTGFGWAKPVGVNPMYYKNRKAGMALVGLAGPLSNFVLAIIAVILFRLTNLISVKAGLSGTLISGLYNIWGVFAIRNLSFMVFNLIPIPPLDGSKILGMFLPNSIYYKMLQYERYSIILIMILSLTGMFSRILSTGVYGVLNFVEMIVGFVFNFFI